jgi:hypothetical protein
MMMRKKTRDTMDLPQFNLEQAGPVEVLGYRNECRETVDDGDTRCAPHSTR